jgi:pimeloyl-ACP methyl ester carboxylesterase
MAFASAFTEHRTVKAGGIDVHVGEVGAGPPVLLLHGNPDTHTVWSGVARHLAAKHRCIAPDLPGFGDTAMPASFTCTLAEQGAFVRDLVAALGLDQFHLVVHDVGGPYGLAFAAEHAGKLRSLTIFNTTMFPDYKWHFWARVWRTPVLGRIAMAAMNRPLFIRELRRGSPRMPREYAEHAYAQITAASKRAVLKWYREMDPEKYTGWDTKLLAATAKTPKLVLWGDLDPFLPSKDADRFGAATVHHYADCGHWLMQEEPERAATQIAQLVATL